MKVFISWSGEKSRQIAEILNDWIPAVIQAAKPYFTPDDVVKGARWNTEISKELEISKAGLICLTPENLESSWIMFEAGALSKNLDKSKVCPILFQVDPTDIKGPLVQFQAAKFEKREIRRVVRMMNKELGEVSLSNDVLDSVFNKWWPELEENINKLLSTETKGTEQSKRSERDILEEILVNTRAFGRTNIRKDELGRIHPTILRQLCRSLDKISSIIASSKEDVGLVRLVRATIENPVAHIIHMETADGEVRETLFNILRDATKILRRAEEAITGDNDDIDDLIPDDL